MSDVVGSPQALIVRGIEAVEGTKGALGAVEKSLDELRVEVHGTSRSAAATEGYLRRIAEAEEERLKLAREQELRRDAWLTRVWSSGPVQILLVLVVYSILNTLGLQWMAKEYLSQNVAVPLEAPHEP